MPETNMPDRDPQGRGLGDSAQPLLGGPYLLTQLPGAQSQYLDLLKDRVGTLLFQKSLSSLVGRKLGQKYLTGQWG